MKYLYTLILTLFLASCSVWNSVENTTSETTDNKSNTENNSWEIMTPPDWDNADRPEPPEWWDDTERPSRWYRNTESWVDTSTSAS